jgi:hypothetical protein
MGESPPPLVSLQWLSTRNGYLEGTTRLGAVRGVIGDVPSREGEDPSARSI